MQRFTMRLCVALAVAALGAWPSLGAQGGGIVTGRIVDDASGAPVGQVQISVPGTAYNTLTSENGRYALRALSAGTIVLDVRRIGYEPTRLTITVLANAPVVADLALTQTAFSLAAVMTTVSGPQRKVELANSTTQIDVAGQLGALPVTNMGGLLSGRAAGVQVVQTGETGTGSRIRIRGQSSLSLSNDPIIFIDGIRATANVNNMLGVGGPGPSRLDDINPAEIETIEVVKGPSAATLYGTEAANGVIVITTKRGKSGKTRHSVSAENGSITNIRPFPDLWALWGKTSPTGVSTLCQLPAVASKSCTIDSLSRGNVLNDPRTTTIDQGSRAQYNYQVSGGSDQAQYFVSAQTEQETGIYKMPEFEVARLTARRGISALPATQMRPNALRRNTLRANLTAQLAPNLSVQVSSSLINSDLRLPFNEDNSQGIMVNSLGGAWRRDLLTSEGDSLRGYRAFNIGDVLSQTTTQATNRFVTSASAQYTPVSWLATRATFGSDYTNRNDQFLVRVGEGVDQSASRGNIESLRVDYFTQSVDLGGTASFALRPWLGSKTSGGMQYVRAANGRTDATGSALPPGGETVSAAATRSGEQGFTDRRTLGYYVEQQLAIHDQLFLTGGVRRDAASAFGPNTKAVYYPKLGASWMASEQSFLPKPAWMNSLRLRAAYGASGQIPLATDAVRFFRSFSTTMGDGSNAAGASLSSIGDAYLRPEYSAETEFGFDLTMFSGRTNLEFTSYDKKTRDALISRNIAPSLSGITSQLTNIGNVRNTGVELTVNQKVIDHKQIAIELTLTGSTNKNRLVQLGRGVSPIASGNRSTQRNLSGYPMFGLWDRAIGFTDTNNDGIIVLGEMTFSDTSVFQGPTYPGRELAFTPRIELLNHRLRLSSQFDSKWGMLKFNNTLRAECANNASCRGRNDRSAPLQMQAGALATTQTVFTGMFEDGAFTRWREASVSYEMPATWAHAIRADRWAIVFTGRNLGVRTRYSGVDPEAAVSSGDTRGGEEYFSTPPLRYFTLRMNFGF